MKNVFKKSKWEYVRQFTTFILLVYLIPSAFQNKLLFLDQLLKAEIVGLIQTNLFWIILLAYSFDLIASLQVHRIKDEKFNSRIFDNLCKTIFKNQISPKCTEDSLVRVSMFRVINRDSLKPKLTMVGRHQKKQRPKFTDVVFNADEGCVGMAYSTGSNIHKSISPFNETSPEKYYLESMKEFKLPREKSAMLHDKACDFLCIPIKYFQADEVWGVLSVDSMRKEDSFTDKSARKIEDELACFRALLMLH